jgi:predicted nucleotide-binding protein
LAANINPALLTAIIGRAGLSKAQVYARIKQIAGDEYLPRKLAAIKYAASLGVTINKYASTEELNELRQAGSPVAPPSRDEAVSKAGAKPVTSTTKPKSRVSARHAKKTANQVFVVHGRDRKVRDAVFTFLRSIGVKPIEWNAAIKMSGKAAPYVGEILSAAFEKARAVVVILSPDDLAVLREDLISPSDPPFEKRQTGQARPNVLFEAGMAFSSHPDRTVMVQLGNVRPFSDTAGRHVVHMSNDVEKRKELATKLENAGCNVDTDGTDWLSAGDFTDPEMRSTPSNDLSSPAPKATPRRRR